MNDLRSKLSECPLEYQVPHIPGSHTALVIEINTADIDWQEKMLPWTLASLINNTDIVMKGVHLYVVCEDGDPQDRIKTALKKFDLPPGTITHKDDNGNPLIVFGKYGYRYDSVCILDINYWAFRGIGKSQDADIKLPFGHVLRHNWGWGVADYSLHPANDILQKDTWVRMSAPLLLTGGDSLERRKKLVNHLMDASDRAKWLHAANTAVYGEDYKKQNRNVAAYFFNETEPNWHLDASILQYATREVNGVIGDKRFPFVMDWLKAFSHLGTEALIALYLLKTQQHAYNLQDSITIHPSYLRAEDPRLCNMHHGTPVENFRYAIKELMGDHMSLNPKTLS